MANESAPKYFMCMIALNAVDSSLNDIDTNLARLVAIAPEFVDELREVPYLLDGITKVINNVNSKIENKLLEIENK